MILKRKLYSVMDEEGNLGYYLYDEATGEEKLFSVVEENGERMFADLDEDDVKFLEEHARNKKRNARNLRIKKGISTGFKLGLSGLALDQVAKSPTKVGKFVKKHNLPIAAGIAGAGLLDLYQTKKDRKTYDELHDKVRYIYINSDKETRKNIRNMSNKKRLKMAYNKQIEEALQD